MNFKKTFLVALIFALLITVALPAVMGGMSSQAGQNLPVYTITMHSFQLSAMDLSPVYTSDAGKTATIYRPNVSWNS